MAGWAITPDPRLGSGIVGDFRGAETAGSHPPEQSFRTPRSTRFASSARSTANDRVHLRITNNTIASIDDDEGGGAGVIPGIEVTTNAATNGDIFLTMTGNTSTGINEDGILIRQATLNNTFLLEDFAGNGTVAADVDAYLTALNTSTVRVRTGGSVVNYGTMNNNNTNTPAPVSPMTVGAPPLALPTDEDKPAKSEDKTGGELSTDSGPGSGNPASGDLPASTPAETGAEAPVVIDDGILSEAELDMIIDAAIQRWADAGATAEQLDAMRAATVTVVESRRSQPGFQPGRRHHDRRQCRRLELVHRCDARRRRRICRRRHAAARDRRQRPGGNADRPAHGGDARARPPDRPRRHCPAMARATS